MMKNEHKGFAIGCDLVAAVVVGVFIGIAIDKHFDTQPWFLIVFFFLGTAAGILNVIKTIKKFEK